MKNSSEITMKWVTVSPDVAREWLEKFNTKNRPVVDGVVERYAHDMTHGNWKDRNPIAPIVFDWNGELVDGQHRLWALFYSGQTFTFLVEEGVDPDFRYVTDLGKSRNVSHMLHFDGVKASPHAIGIVNRMVVSFSTGKKFTIAEQRAAYLRHQEAVEWVLESFNSKTPGLRSASILAPVARAWYTKDRAFLARFLEVLRTGQPADQLEYVVILLRDYAMQKTRSGTNAGYLARIEMYGKAERAIVAFLLKEILSRLSAVSEEQFPLPEEVPKSAKKGAKKPAARIVKRVAPPMKRGT